MKNELPFDDWRRDLREKETLARAILDVDETAGRKAISRAYHKLARRYHPDATDNARAMTVRFREVTAAYRLLTRGIDADLDPARAGIGEPKREMSRNEYEQWWRRSFNGETRSQSEPKPERRPERANRIRELGQSL